MASDTPRTEAATLRYRYSERRGDWHGSDYFDYVEPESMAELERELAAANTRADSAKRDALEEAAKLCEANCKASQVSIMPGKYAECMRSSHLIDALAIRTLALDYAAPQSEQSVQAPSGGQPQEAAGAATPWYDRPESTNAAPPERIVQQDSIEGQDGPARDRASAAPTRVEDLDITGFLRNKKQTAAVASPSVASADSPKGAAEPPSAVSIPGLPPDPQFMTGRFLDNMPVAAWCHHAQWKELRDIAEQLRAGWVASDEHARSIAAQLNEYVRHWQQRAERAEAECARLRDLLCEASSVLKEEASTHGHSHWDEKGTHGANCPICIRQINAGGRKMSQKIDAAIDAARKDRT